MDDQPMDDEIFCCLHAAIALARDEQIKRLDGLCSRLRQEYDDDTVEHALKYWANYEAEKAARFGDA